MSTLSDQIKQGIRNWNNGKDHPLMEYADTLAQAGEQMPKGVSPYLPTILALRETQGGQYNVGKNNIYNLRDNTGHFVSYPDVQTAILGGVNPLYNNVHSSGVVGVLNGDKPENQGLYADFRKSGDTADLWKHWSPPTDNNGSIPEQVDNYNWMMKRFDPNVTSTVAPAQSTNSSPISTTPISQGMSQTTPQPSSVPDPEKIKQGYTVQSIPGGYIMSPPKRTPAPVQQPQGNPFDLGGIINSVFKSFTGG
jgi:hypothetical protein